MSCCSPDPLVTLSSIRLTNQLFQPVESGVGAASLPGGLVSPRDSHSDEELLSRARAGDAEAFRVIFDREAPGVRRFLGDLLRDDVAADEGTQETFVRAHERLATLAARGKVTGWLFGRAGMGFFVQ